MAKRKAQSVSSKRPAPKAVEALQSPTEGMTGAQKIAWFALLAAVFLVPVMISNWTWLGFRMPMTYDQFDIIKAVIMRAAATVAIGALGWHILVEGGKVRRTPVEWIMLAFIGWVALSAVFSIHPATAIFGKYRRFEGLISFITYFALYWTTLQLADRASRIKQLTQTLFWAGFIVSAYGIAQFLGFDLIKWATLPFEARRAFSTYGNPDLLGGFLMFSLPISAALALSETKTWWRATYWVGFLMASATWIVAFTRGAWLGGFVGLVFLAILVWRQKGWPPAEKSERNVDLVFIAVTVFVVVALAVASLGNANEVMNFGKRFASIFDFQSGSGQTRTQIWQAAIDAIKDRPIFGFGADTFRLVFPKYKPAAYVQAAGYLSVADNVHNYPLQLASGVGIIGMLLLYATFAWAAIRSGITLFKRPEKQSLGRVLIAGFWAACAGYIMLLFTGLSVTGTTMFLWIAMGVVLSPTAKPFELERTSWGVAVASLTIAVCSILFVLNGMYFYADSLYLKGRLLPSGPERLAYAERAVQLNPFNDMYRTDRGVAYTDYFFDTLRAALASGADVQSQQATRQAFDLAAQRLQDAIEFTPWEYDNYVFLANLYLVAGDYFGPDMYQKAVEIGRKGVEVEPYGPAIRYQLAMALDKTGKRQEAIKELEVAVKLDPAYVEGTLGLARLLVAEGRQNEALKLLLDAEAYRPGQPGIADQIRSLEASGATTTGN